MLVSSAKLEKLDKLSDAAIACWISMSDAFIHEMFIRNLLTKNVVAMKRN